MSAYEDGFDEGYEDAQAGEENKAYTLAAAFGMTEHEMKYWDGYRDGYEEGKE